MGSSSLSTGSFFGVAGGDTGFFAGGFAFTMGASSSLSSAVAVGLSIACVAAIVAALILEGSTTRVKHPKRNRERNLDT